MNGRMSSNRPPLGTSTVIVGMGKCLVPGGRVLSTGRASTPVLPHRVPGPVVITS